jgi:hypothetical protein
MQVALDLLHCGLQLLRRRALFRVERIGQRRLKEHFNDLAQDIAFSVRVVVQPALRIDEPPWISAVSVFGSSALRLVGSLGSTASRDEAKPPANDSLARETERCGRRPRLLPARRCQRRGPRPPLRGCRFTLEPETGADVGKSGTENETGASFSLDLGAKILERCQAKAA